VRSALAGNPALPTGLDWDWPASLQAGAEPRLDEPEYLLCQPVGSSPRPREVPPSARPHPPIHAVLERLADSQRPKTQKTAGDF
jgi:hypothetical protein